MDAPTLEPFLLCVPVPANSFIISFKVMFDITNTKMAGYIMQLLSFELSV